MSPDAIPDPDGARAQIVLLEHELERRRAAEVRLAERLLATQAQLDAARAGRLRQAPQPVNLPERPTEPDPDIVAAIDAAATRLRRAAPLPPAVPLHERPLPAEPLAPWLTRALGAVDPQVAVEALAELAPAQAAALRRDLRYELVAGDDGVLRVTLTADGSGRVERRDAPSPAEVEAVLIGATAALAPLVAGGAGRRLHGVTVAGRRRAVARLLRARRDPAPLDDLRLLDPERLLRLLVAAAPAPGAPLAVDVTLGDRTLRVGTGAGGLRIAEGATGEAEADLWLGRGGLVDLLARRRSDAVVVEGAEQAVLDLVALFDRAVRTA